VTSYRYRASYLLTAVVFAVASVTGNAWAGEQPPVIAFTQTGCQFLESENGVDHGFVTTRQEDCEAINAKSGDERLAKAKIMHLKAGKYTFRVTNKNVPYSLGFYLRGDGVFNYATLPRVSGGGLTTGTSRDYTIELKPGSYVYSCPLNPTPNYRLEVTAG
jgi:hypothetical protein